MKPRPLYRWKSFWLGVLVIAFLGWAWKRSTTTLSQALWSGSTTDVFLGQFPSYVIVGFRGPGLSPGPGFHFDDLSLHEKSVELFPPGVSIVLSPTARARGVSFAHWFLILLFFVSWFAFLAWRWRRIKRLDAPRG